MKDAKGDYSRFCSGFLCGPSLPLRAFAQNPVVVCARYSLVLENGEATAQWALGTTNKKTTEVEIEISAQTAEQLRMDIGR